MSRPYAYGGHCAHGALSYRSGLLFQGTGLRKSSFVTLLGPFSRNLTGGKEVMTVVVDTLKERTTFRGADSFIHIQDGQRELHDGYRMEGMTLFNLPRTVCPSQT